MNLRVIFLLILMFAVSYSAIDAAPILVSVNGEKIDQSHRDLYLLTLGINEADSKKYEKVVLEQLIDRTLMRQFLASRKVTAPKATLERQLSLIEKVLSKVESPEETLKRLGLTRKDLEKELSLPLAWRRYVLQITTEKEIAGYFEQHRDELDGTKRKASQIFLKLSSDATGEQKAAATNRLLEIKNQIERQELTFDQAAQKHSESPSAKQGGDLGTFPFNGQMPAEITKEVFGTKVGKIGQPFVTQFGAHLIYVEDEIEGLLSLEDARPEILSRLVKQKWDFNIQRLRRSAKISYQSE